MIFKKAIDPELKENFTYIDNMGFVKKVKKTKKGYKKNFFTLEKIVLIVGIVSTFVLLRIFNHFFGEFF